MAAPGTPRGSVLKDVVAYVEVWSANGTENYSKTFTNQLVEMGAKVSKTFSKQVTHVVFKDGYPRTWDKARERGVRLVSVLWVEKCRTAGAHVDESLYPAANTHEHLPCLVKKKHRCMQPKDFLPRKPENDKRLQKKFEKMANELKRQKTTLDSDHPVLLFESNGSLGYSPTTAACRGHHSTMARRLQAMKEKRENLSPTSSQVAGKPYDSPADGPADASFEAPLSVSRESSCSEDSSAGCLQLSFDDPCVNAGHGDQQRELGGSGDDAKSHVCASVPALRASGARSPASPRFLGQVTPQASVGPRPKEEGTWQRDPGGAVAPPGPQTLDEKCRSSPAWPAAEGHHPGHPRPRGSSAKRKRALERVRSPPEERQRKKKCGRKSAVSVRLFASESGLQGPASSAVGTPDRGAALYEDYFSPDNLKERSTEDPHPGRQSPPGPARPSCRVALSKRERASVLGMSDFSCLGRNPSSADAASGAAASPHPQGPGGDEPQAPVGATASRRAPAAAAEAPGRGDGSPEGRASADPHREPAGGRERTGRGPCGTFTPSQRERKEPAGEADVRGPREGDAASGRLTSSEDVTPRPPRREVPEGSRESCEDLRPVAARKRGKSQKPTRTLVMTSMPSEKQNIVTGVVAKLQGFTLAREVCDTTTHVLAGQALRTLNVLLGLARGCWVLSWEWVLWSLELGHWISEEPFELSDAFPAAPLCRRERQLSAGQYQGTLFADQPTMFISPASDPPRAKLWELVLLCGGRVTGVSRQASLFIGPCHGRKKEAVTYLTEKWILDSVTRHTVCACEDYVLQ